MMAFTGNRLWLLVILLAVTGSLQAAFDTNQMRYLSPFDILQTQKTLFPVTADSNAKVAQNCQELDVSNRSVIGDNQPVTGKPAIAHPSGGFMRWYATCLTEYIQASTQQARDYFDAGKKTAPVAYLWGPKFLGWIQTQTRRGTGWDMSWKHLPAIERETFLNYQIERMIGPETVITDLGLCKSQRELRVLMEKTFEESETVNSALQKSMFFLGMRDEFLTY